MSNDKIKDRIKSLLAKSADPAASEAEADACITKAHKLMEEYGLSAEDCETAEGDDYIERGWEPRHSEKHGPILHPVDKTLLGLISKFCGVKYWYSRRCGHLFKVCFFGLDSDVALAEWMRAEFIKKYDRDWEQYKYFDRKNKSLRSLKDARISFTEGYSNALHDRFDRWFYRAEQAGGSTALVFRKQDLISAELERRGVKLHATSASRPRANDTLAAGAGYNSGQSARISTDVHAGTAQLLLK